MFKKYRQLMAGILIGSIVSGIGVASANGSFITAQVVDYIKFKFDGTEKQVPAGYTVLMYQDRTYVPARFVGEQLGAKVDWDGNTNSVIINKNGDVSSGSKSFPVDVNITSGSMKMKISKVTLDPAYKKDDYLDPIKAVVFDVEVENTSTETVNWAPRQGTYVFNTKEQADGVMSMIYSDQVDGEFVGEVIKRGKIAIKVDSDLSQIKTINIKISGAFDSSLNRVGSDTLTDITLY